MGKNCDAFLFNRCKAVKILIPACNPCYNQQHDQNAHTPKIELLAGVISAQFGKLILMAGEDIANPLQPCSVLCLPEVQPPETEEQTEETEKEHNTDPRVDNARQLSAAEQCGKEKQRRIKQRKAGNSQ